MYIFRTRNHPEQGRKHADGLPETMLLSSNILKKENIRIRTCGHFSFPQIDTRPAADGRRRSKLKRKAIRKGKRRQLLRSPSRRAVSWSNRQPPEHEPTASRQAAFPEQEAVHCVYAGTMGDYGIFGQCVIVPFCLGFRVTLAASRGVVPKNSTITNNYIMYLFDT